MSAMPPTGNGTMMRIGLEGYGCASAGAMPSEKRTSTIKRASISVPLSRDEGVAEAPGARVVALHRGEDTPQVAPRRRIRIEAVQKQHVRDEARHPVDRRGVADHGAHAGGLHEVPGKQLPLLAAQDVAGGEIH